MKNKNINITPKDNPSRLAILHDGKLHIGTNFKKDLNVNPQNIYITNDEKIKEGEYNIPSDFSRYSDISKTSKEDLQIVNEKSNGYKKIILTTDQDLIKDGVQAIDDEFLEWFVKNPSCEIVEVEIDYSKSVMNYSYKTNIGFELWRKKESINCGHCGGDGIYITSDNDRLECPICEKGKIPKEEPKKCICFNELEYQECCVDCENSFNKQKRMYSEEECYRTLHNLMTDIKLKGLKINDDIDLKKWFEQFKKK